MLGTDQAEVLTVQFASLMTKSVEIQVLGERLLIIEVYDFKECAILFAYFYHSYHSVMVLGHVWRYATQGNSEVQIIRSGREPPFSLPLL